MANTSNKPASGSTHNSSILESLSFSNIMEEHEQTSQAIHRQDYAIDKAPTDQAKRARLSCRIPLIRNQTIPEIYKSPGLQNKELQRLKQGKIYFGSSIDLHGCTAEEALIKLDEAIQLSRSNRLRCILVICGKGLHSHASKAVLKDVIRSWLTTHPEVLAYCWAKPRHGGNGALYVLLKVMRKA